MTALYQLPPCSFQKVIHSCASSEIFCKLLSKRSARMRTIHRCAMKSRRSKVEPRVAMYLQQSGGLEFVISFPFRSSLKFCHFQFQMSAAEPFEMQLRQASAATATGKR